LLNRDLQAASRNSPSGSLSNLSSMATAESTIGRFKAYFCAFKEGQKRVNKKMKEC
jgi:hypothetical protein